MQQTQNYKLNLIETSDPLSPAPLNENADTLDAALADETRTRQAETTDLFQRVTLLEARHFLVGSYVGIGEKTQDIMLGFTPKGVLVQGNNENHELALALGDEPGQNHYGVVVEIIQNGFRAVMNGRLNQTQKGRTFYFADHCKSVYDPRMYSRRVLLSDSPCVDDSYDLTLQQGN